VSPVSDLSAFRAVISGRVTGVGFRYEALHFATARSLGGWARNLDDGRLEVFAEGPDHLLSEFREWLRVGPPAARVDAVEFNQVPWDQSRAGAFTIRP